MNTNEEILRSLGRIEGRLDGLDKRMDQIERLNGRVLSLETALAWLKGGLALLAAAYWPRSRCAGQARSAKSLRWPYSSPPPLDRAPRN